MLSLTDALNRLNTASKSDLYVELEVESGRYIIPYTFIPMLVGTQSQGKLYEHAQGGKSEAVSILSERSTPTDSTNANVTIPADERWDIVGAICEYVATGVAARTCRFKITPPLLAGVTNSLFLATNTFNLADAQDAFLYFPPRSYHFQNLNGTPSIVADESPLSTFGEDTIFETDITTNKQVGDRTGLTIFYKKVG